MFTGIIEEVGIVKSLKQGSDSVRIEISAKKVLEDVRLGDSIAVNGICLTVVSFTNSSFLADVMHETLNRSSLGKLKIGSSVNLERALSLSSRLGGHIVSGHVDGIGTIKSIEKDDNAIWYEIETQRDILDLIVMKGSITIDGISLTVAKLESNSFSVSIIPHTASHTTLADKRVGDVVNLENDVIGKYVQRLLGGNSESLYSDLKSDGNGSAKQTNTKATSSGRLTKDFLLENGFL